MQRHYDELNTTDARQAIGGQHDRNVVLIAPRWLLSSSACSLDRREFDLIVPPIAPPDPAQFPSGGDSDYRLDATNEPRAMLSVGSFQEGPGRPEGRVHE